MRERRTGAFQRSVTLGTPVNADKASARFEHGVLTLTLPKSEQAPPSRSRSVSTSFESTWMDAS